MQRMSPFLVLDYNAPYEFKGTDSSVGVDAHPHRGIETVTFAFDGFVSHHDNQGHSGVIGPGDIQWMTAGAGILHKEYHEKEYAKNDRMFHMVQLWVNLPKEHKMTPPKYQALTKEEMARYEIPGGGGEVTVYAGDVLGAKGPASTFLPMNLYRVDIKTGAELEIVEPQGYNTALLVLGGKVELNGRVIEHRDFALMANDDGALKLKGLEGDAMLLVLSGEPLNEPIAAAGPFVMNTREEIHQANEDFYLGKFGSMDF